MNPIDGLKRHFANVDQSRQMLEEIRAGIANLTDVTNRHLLTLIKILEATTKETKCTDAHPLPQPAAEAPLDVALATIRSYAGQEKISAQIFDRVLDSVVVPNHRSHSWGDRLLTLDKTAGFRDDPHYQSAFAQTTGETGATQYASPDGISWRLNTLLWAARNALRIPGDLVELGVYKGDMSWVITRMIDLPAHNKTFYLYDTFEGFAPQHSSGEDFATAPGFFERADAIYRAPDLYESVCRRFSGDPHVKVVKGTVPEILHERSPARISFLHVDLNSAAPEIGALRVLFDRVSPGGIIVFDDYGWVLHRNQKDAEDAYMARLDYEIFELPTGQGIVIKR